MNKKTNKKITQQNIYFENDEIDLFSILEKLLKFKLRIIAVSIIASFLGNSDMQVNHIDGNRLNNSLSNLEYVTQRENQSHRRKMKGYDVGVCWANKENKWRAYIQVNKKWQHLGFYNEKIDAKNAYLNKLKELGIQNRYAV